MATANLQKNLDAASASDGKTALIATTTTSAEEAALIYPSRPLDKLEQARSKSSARLSPDSWPGVYRLIDVVGAFVLIMVLLPALLLIALAVFVSSPGSPIFAHRRIGKDGKPFNCLKFRSMYAGAEQRLAKLLENDPVMRAQWEADFKLERDPRVTPIGRFLRVTSLDELPQLVNVLKGEMSLVGPRPIISTELDRYGRYSTSYLSLKPGLTGLWQVTGRSDTSYRRRVAADHVYARNKCLFLDMQIIAATVPAVLLGKGAC